MPEQPDFTGVAPGIGAPACSDPQTVRRQPSSSILLPLYHSPSHVKVFSEDAELAAHLGTVQSADFTIRVHASSNAFLDELQQEPPIAENDLWRQRHLLDSAHSRALIPRVLKYWQTAEPAPNLARVCVIDKAAILLPDLLDWDGHRILIASDITEAQATELMGEGLVHQVLRRGQFGWKSQLLAKLRWQMAKPRPSVQHLWASHLSREQAQVLRDPITARELITLARQRWVHWACVSAPFGILGLSATHQVEWLQLQLTRDVGRAILQAEQLGFSGADISAVAGCRSLVDQDLRQQLGLEPATSAVPAFHIGEDGSLIGAWRPVRKPTSGRKTHAHPADLARAPT